MQILNQFFAWIGKACEENPGEPSLLRVVVLFGVVVVLVVPIGIWAMVAIHTKSIPEVPGSVSGFFLTLHGSLLAAKVGQKAQEGKS